MQIDEAFVDSQAPNAAAIKNARGVVIKRKLVGLFKSPDGTLLFGDCKGSGADNYVGMMRANAQARVEGVSG